MKDASTSAGALGPSAPRAEDRLDSWKEIAAYLRRGVRTVRRWEREEGLPVHRHLHRRLGTVYAYKSEIDAWWDARGSELQPEQLAPDAAERPPDLSLPQRVARRGTIAAVAAAMAIGLALVASWPLWRNDRRLPGAADRVTLAVLPFQNLTGDAEQEFFSDGLTEELVTELGRLKPERLGVIARTSAMHYKGSGKRAEAIARELGVDYLVEGSVRRGAGRLRITAQLIRASDETHLWAESYERPVSGPLAVQAEVVRAVAAEIQRRFAEPAMAAPASRPQPGAEAYEAYLKGRYFLERRTPEALSTARRWFERAIALEQGYAAALVGLADYHILAVTYAAAVPNEAMEAAREAIHKALALDARLAEAHAWHGVILTEHDWNWAAADQAFRRAIELDPNFAYAHKLYAEYLSYVGRFDEAVAEARLARRLDPVSIVTNATVGFVLYRARRYHEALDSLLEAVRLDPDHALPYLPLGLAYAQLGRYGDAMTALERARILSGDNSEMVAQLGYVHARAGQVASARERLAALGARARTEYVPPFHFAIVHAGLGDIDNAMSWLEQGLHQRLWLMCVVKTDPIFDPLRGDERFQSLLRRMNLLDAG